MIFNFIAEDVFRCFYALLFLRNDIFFNDFNTVIWSILNIQISAFLSVFLQT